MSAAKCSALAFRWGQLSHHANSRTYYDGFTLQQTRYDVGALVYLLPEEQGAPLFIGRLLAAFIDSSAGKGSEAYSIEVRLEGLGPGPPADARQNAKPDTDARQPRAAAVGMRVPSACQGGAAIGLFSAQPRRSQAFRPRVTDLQHPTRARTAMHACQVRWFERMPDREVVELDETDVNPAGCLAGIAPVVFADTREQVCFLAWHIPHGLPGRTRPHFAWHSAGHWPCCIRTRASAPMRHLPCICHL